VTEAALEPTRSTAPADAQNAGDAPCAILVVDELTKIYRAAPPPGRIVRLMTRFGGGGADRIDVNDDDDDFDDMDDAPLSDDQTPRTDAVILDRISFEVKAGTCVAIVGPPKSGKSTLLRVLAGITPPTHGRVVVHGRVAPALDDLIRALPQRLTLAKAALLLATMVRLPRREIARRLHEVFELPNLSGQEQSQVGQSTQKRRRQLLLGVMLAADPVILLFDSPLDGGTRKRLLARVDEMKREGGVVVVAARDVESVDFADRVLLLHGGTIAADGSPAAVLEQIRRERAAGDDTVLPPLTDDAQRYAEFLRVALGVFRAEDAVRHATLAAAEAGRSSVDWEAIATAAPMPLHEAQGVVDRLRRAEPHLDGG
jgi:ABC-type polysaccharide/polyol phosphate transport system ATPase subunit